MKKGILIRIGLNTAETVTEAHALYNYPALSPHLRIVTPLQWRDFQYVQKQYLAALAALERGPRAERTFVPVTPG